MIAVVTGASRGIGAAIASALRADDNYYEVIQLTRDLTRHIPRIGKVGVLVNCAGEQNFFPAAKYPKDKLIHDLELMTLVPLRLAQMVYPYMSQHGGHIINILSTSAFQGARNIVGYVAAKHALLGITRCLAIEWAPKIHVNAVAPGFTETRMTANLAPERRALLESITPSGRFSTPEEIADAVLFLVHSTNIYGQVITVDGGWMVKNG